jgi:tyrosyl-tRNA synthetase
VLVSSGLVSSKSEARKALDQGGIYVNNLRRGVGDGRITRDDLVHDRYVVLRRGRQSYHLLRFE